MRDEKSLLTIAIANPAAPAEEYGTEAILFLADEAASQNALMVTVTNISEGSIPVQQGAKIKLDFARVPLAPEAVKNIKLSQPAKDWSATANDTVLELIYQGADFLWDDGTPLAFTLDGIVVEFEKERAGTLTVEVDQIPTLSNGMGEWKHAALLARAPKVDLPSTVQTGMETKALYINGINNILNFYLENKGDDIAPASIEVSLACGTRQADLIGPHDEQPVLTVVKEPSRARLGNINEPFQRGGKLTWVIRGEDILLQKNSQLKFNFSPILTSMPGETIVKIELKNMYAYRDHTFNQPIAKQEAPPLEIRSFDGWIQIVDGKPELVLKWETHFAKHCTIKPMDGLFEPNSPPDGYRVFIQEPVNARYTVTAYAEQESVNVNQTVDVRVLEPEIRELRIYDKNGVKGQIFLEWSTANAKTVHLKLHEEGKLGTPSANHFDGDVQVSGKKMVEIGGVLLLRWGSVILTAYGLEGSKKEKVIPWSY